MLKAERLLETYLGVVPSGLVSFSAPIPTWLAIMVHSTSIRKKLGRDTGDPCFSLNITSHMLPAHSFLHHSTRR